MPVAHLEVLEDILKKCHNVYRIEEVQLGDDKWRETLAEARLWQKKVVAAACNASLIRHPKQQLGTLRVSSFLKKLSIGWAALGLQHIVAICSALRYDNQIDTITLNGLIFAVAKKNQESVSQADREQCWRWIAYGMFYPHSKQLAPKHKLQVFDLSVNLSRFGNAAAFTKTLLDPAGELVFQGKLGPQPVNNELLIYTIKHGAKFYANAELRGDVVHELQTEMKLEALC